MITCSKDHLEARCRERGYSLADVMPCVVSQNGDSWTIDTEHSAYPHDRSLMHEYSAPVPAGEVSVYRCLHCGWGIATKGQPPARACPSRKPQSVEPPKKYGPGTELKKLLGRVGITATPTCSCNRRAREMDENGIQWCRDNLDLIAGDWLAGEAKKRKLPYSEFAGRKLVQLAIALAERNAAKAGN